MSLMSYNGVTFPYLTTSSFHQEAVYDPSGTDRYGTKFDIQASFVLHADYFPMLGLDAALTSTTNPAVLMRLIRNTLMQPRKTLSYKVGGVELIPFTVAGNEGTVDAQNGPKPQRCDIQLITNTSFLVNFHIIAHYFENLTAAGTINSPGNTVLYNRWRETVELDNRNYATRTRKGTFRIRSDNPKGQIADDVFTAMAVLSIPPGFLRIRRQREISEDGLTMEYTIQDKEQHKMPPEPAYEASGYYLETTTRMAAQRTGEVHVQLKGDKRTNQAQLIKTALQIAVTKLASRGGSFNVTVANNVPQVIQVVNDVEVAEDWTVLEGAHVRYDMFENVVECSIRFWTASKKGADVYGIHAFAGIKTETPLVTEAYTPPYPERGTANLLVQAANYYDPSFVSTAVGNGSQTRLGDNPLVDTFGRKVQLDRGLPPGKAGKTQET